MANIVKVKRSNVAGKVPTTTEITGGELGVNMADKKIFINNGANIEQVGSGTLAGLSDSAITNPLNNDYLIYNGTKWVNTDRVNAKTISEIVKNVSGATLAKGTPVYQVGIAGNAVTVGYARADDPNKVAIGVMDETTADQAEGRMTILGEIKGVNTNGFATGDKVYLGATGGYTNIAPTDSNVFQQFLGVVFRIDGNNGSGYITGTLTEDVIRWTGTVLQYWNGTTWTDLDSGSSGAPIQGRYEYIATEAQTTFSAEYTAPYVDVFYNGNKLTGGVDYTATSGTNIVLTDAAIAGDSVDIIAYTSSVIAEAKFAKVANNLSDLANAGTARVNLGLGSVATRNAPSGTLVGTTDAQTLTNKTMQDPLLLLGGTYGTAGQIPVSQGSGLPAIWGTVAADLARIVKPTCVSPANAATNVVEQLTLTGSSYYSLYGVVKAAAQWQISTSATFDTFVLNTGDVLGTSVTYLVAEGTLALSTTYYWRTRYKDSEGLYSEWSTAAQFTTSNTFGPADGGPTTIGQAYGGGYYAGKIVRGGVQYYLIVSPAASGQSSGKTWKVSTDAAPTETITLNNGLAASTATNTASYPAAQFCRSLTIGGFSDWYLPARDELELLHRNFKPSGAATNNITTRNFSAYTYPENTDVSTDTMGINRNSYPTGSAYTASVPAVSATQLGFSSSVYYWSSSEFSTTQAWMQSFYNGTQLADNKTVSAYARAVRRIRA